MEYLLFHFEDLEDIVKEIPGLTHSFRRFGEVEVIAVDEEMRVVVERYGKYVVVVTHSGLGLTIEPLAAYSVELGIPEEPAGEFAMGRYRVRGDRLYLDGDLDDELIYGHLPALLCEVTTARILIKDSRLRAEHLSRDETAIISDTVRILEGAGKMEISVLEKLALELSSLKAGFFSSYMTFKDENEEIGLAILRARKISRLLGNLLSEWVDELVFELESLKYYETSFEQTLSGVRDALETVHLRLEMLHRGENLELQKRTSSLQAAAAIIEFVAVFYYSMGIWDKYIGLHGFPKWVTFTLLTLLSGVVVFYTEVIGEYLSEGKAGKKLAITTALLLLTLVFMVLLPAIF
ncbi:hypothetical protein [Geoglobus sp.]